MGFFEIYLGYAFKRGTSVGVCLICDPTSPTPNDFRKIIIKSSEEKSFLLIMIKAVCEALETIEDFCDVEIICDHPGFEKAVGRSKYKESGERYKELVKRFASVSILQENQNRVPLLKKARDLAYAAILGPKQQYAEDCNKTNIIPDYVAYTDGSCNNFSPYGEGGAAYIILDKTGHLIYQNSKGFIGTTNNRMEMLAIISAVNWLPDNASIEIRTDSQYCIGMLSKVECPKKINKNRDLVEKFYRIKERKRLIIFTWVKGHNGNEYNEMADSLAESRTEEMRVLHGIPRYSYHNSPKCR